MSPRSAMIRKTVTGAAWLLLGSCTPLGLWIYEDPVVTVLRVTLQLQEPRSVAGSPVVVALAVHNRNDFPLSSTRMEVSLRLDGVPIGRLKQDSTVSVATDAISTVRSEERRVGKEGRTWWWAEYEERKLS